MPTVGPTKVAVLGEEGQSEDGEGAPCSTAPLPRMQCDTRHREMAVKVQGKNTVIYGSGICRQIRNKRPNLRQILACTRADGEVCAMLNPVQLSIHYYSSSPDPISEADVCPGHDASSPGWVDQEMRVSFSWMGSYFIM